MATKGHYIRLQSIRAAPRTNAPEAGRNQDRTGHITLVLKVQIEDGKAVALFDADLIGRLPDDVV